MVRRFSLGRFDIDISTNARCAWNHFRIHRGEASRHLVWGKLSVVVEDATAPVYRVCAQCGSDEASEQSYGDEGWTVCPDCRSVEQGYRYLTKREWEAM